MVLEDSVDSFFEGLILSFLDSLDQIKRWGLLREDKPVQTELNAIKGQINLSAWTRRTSRYGVFMPPVPQTIYASEYDNIPNRVLKACLDYLLVNPLQHVHNHQVVSRLEYFNQVASQGVFRQEADKLEMQIERGRLPTNRAYYLPALNLALLIFRGAGLALDDPQDVVFKPIIVNTANMFERYIRAVYQEVATQFDAYAEDGRRVPVDFYNRAARPIRVQPDIVIKRGGRTLLVVDVKYKFEPTAQDHYQMWAYLHGHDVKRGGFVNVLRPNTVWSTNPKIYERNDYKISEFGFDSVKVHESESTLKNSIARQLQIALTV